MLLKEYWKLPTQNVDKGKVLIKRWNMCCICRLIWSQL